MRYISIVILALIALNASAQETHAVKGKIEAFKKKVDKGIEADTVKQLSTDSLSIKNSKLDSIRNLNPIQAIKSDSLPNIKDSVNALAGKAEQKVANFQHGFQNKSDSLSRKVSDKTLAIQSKATDKISEVTEKGSGLALPESKLPTIPTKELPGLDNKLSAPALKIPGASDIPFDQGLPKADVDLPSVNLPKEDIDVKIPELKTDIPGAKKLDKISEINEKLPNLPDSTTKPDLSILKEVPGTEKVTGKVDEFTVLKDEAGKYKEQIKEIKDTKIEDIDTKELEQQATKIAPVKELDAQTQKLLAIEKQKADLLKKYSDKKLIHEELKRKTANVVNDRVGKFSPAISDAQSDMGKAKKVYTSSAAISDSTKLKKRENTMAGKPFKKRIVPGITFQTYTGKGELLFDLGPQIGYRFTGWLTMGVGGVYRVGLGKANPNFIEGKNIYGYRLYTDYLLVRGIFLHGDFESLQVGEAQPSLQELPKERVKGSYFGIGKRYSISRNVQGSLLALYRVNYSGSISGQSKFTIRVGFDYVFKKKRKII